MSFYYGWYDGTPTSNGNLVLAYWNHVVNEYPVVGESPNDVIRYSKENYVLSLKKFMDLHTQLNPDKKFLVDIPLCEVYYSGQRTADDGYVENIPIWKTNDWIEYVVKALEFDDRVIGWYHADEPEVWGYREVVNGNVVNENPKLEYSFLRGRYEFIRSISGKLIFAVFCDTALFKSRFYNQIKSSGSFYDVFMFDYYPYSLNLVEPNWKKIRDFVSISNELHPNMKVMYVGQGSGSPQFNTRVPTMDEHERMYVEYCKAINEEKRFGYMLWSHSWADDSARYRGNLTLTENLLKLWETENTKTDESTNVIKPCHLCSVLTKIKNLVKRIFK